MLWCFRNFNSAGHGHEFSTKFKAVTESSLASLFNLNFLGGGELVADAADGFDVVFAELLAQGGDVDVDVAGGEVGGVGEKVAAGEGFALVGEEFFEDGEFRGGEIDGVLVFAELLLFGVEVEGAEGDPFVFGGGLFEEHFDARKEDGQ